MSNEFENNSLDLEQLLRTKSWEQLNDAERSEMTKVVSGREEYMRMFAMTNQLMAGSGVHDEDLKPSENVRGNLMEAFTNEQRKRRAAWWNSLWYGLSDKLRFDIPMVRIAVTAVLLFAGVFGVAKLMDKDSDPQIVNAPQININDGNETPEPVNNNIVEQPVNNAPAVNSDQPIVVDTQMNVNGTQLAVVEQNLIANNVIQDSTPQYITAFTNNGQPLIVDSNMFVLPTATFNATNVLCTGSSNGTVVATGGTNYTYQWTPTATNGMVVGLPPRSRSLENDAAVLDVFFAVK